MDLDTFLALLAKIALAGGGLGLIVYNIFKFLAAKWLDTRFAERLQNLKARQDETIRHVQSSIDREIHRAKKLYDNEFTALTDCWRLLREAYDVSAASIGSFTPQVGRINDEELERHLSKRGMKEWQRNELKVLTGETRQDEYYKWSEWQRYLVCHKAWADYRSKVDANSIFFPEGFTEKFRRLDELIIASNVEFEHRIQEYKVPQYGERYDRFEQTKKLRGEGGGLMKELEGLVRTRLWSVSEAKG